MLLDAIAFSLPNSIIFNIYHVLSLSMQLFCLLAVILVNMLGFIICNRSKQYDLTYVISKLTIEICTLPALILGSMLGIVRKKGNFYKTVRIATTAKKLSTGSFLATKKNETETVS
jgi:hypothetical protein